MSITEELRDWVAGAKPAVVDGCSISVGTMTYGCKKALLAIADRIDAEHERGMADAELGASPTEEQMAELGWVKLPVDADGIPIHVGDTVKAYGETPIYVLGIGRVTREEDGYHGVFTQGIDGRYEWFNARFLHHVQPDSWERIIEDAISECGWEQPKEYEIDFEESREVRDRFVAELVERCRRLAGEDA